jgi:hypothetical protein
MDVKSIDTIEEMKTIIRDGASIEASGRNKDDRVIASALACAAFAEQVQPRLIQMRLTRERSKKLEPNQDNGAIGDISQRTVGDYLKRIGFQ